MLKKLVFLVMTYRKPVKLDILASRKFSFPCRASAASLIGSIRSIKSLVAKAKDSNASDFS